jgi:antitoxin (DNA-binding transcriptional repressor) of toxin-antitoxin stability system
VGEREEEDQGRLRERGERLGASGRRHEPLEELRAATLELLLVQPELRVRADRNRPHSSILLEIAFEMALGLVVPRKQRRDVMLERVRFDHYRTPMKKTSTRALREHLPKTLARAANGEQILVTRRGKAYVRLVPAGPVKSTGERRKYPLRGTLRFLADDFDRPMPDA